MLYTLLDARTFVAKFVEAGTCANRAVVVDRINEACRRLLPEANWSGTIFRLRFATNNNTITLPRNVLRVLKVDVDMTPREVFGISYEFMEGGPGELCPEDGYGPDLLDIGDGWPTFFDIPAGIPSKLIAFSTALEDVGQQLTIMGRDVYNADITTSLGLPGETITIGRWQNGTEGTVNANDLPQTTTNSFTDITAVHKPVTRGFVSLYTYDATDHRMYFLSKYHPDETVPGYRRYRLTDPNFTDVRNVLCQVKLRFVPLSHDNDLLPIQNLDALKQEVISIREENDGKGTSAEAAHNKAIRLLNAQLNDAHDSDDAGIHVQSEMGLGSAPNII